MRTTIALLALLATAGAGRADTYRFDMGSESSPLAAGYTRVTPKTLLAENPDYGWTSAPARVVLRNDPGNPYYAADTSPEYTLYCDGILSLGENTFTFRVKPGRYAVTATIGDMALGEGRPNNSIWANGVPVVTDQATNETVKAFLFSVDAPDGKIALRFRSDSSQKYATVQAVSAEPLSEGQVCTPSVAEYPKEQPGPEVYRRNWARFEGMFAEDWEKAKASLKAEGADLDTWARIAEGLRKQPGYREYWGWNLGSWDRFDQKAGGLTMVRFCAAFLEMGVDGFGASSALAARELPKYGLKRGVHGGAEGFPRPLDGITMNLMKMPDGTTSTYPGVWSNCAPEVIRTFQEVWRARFAETAKGAELFMIDEPRGMFYAGRLGDYSPPAQEAFKRWAAGNGWADLAQKGIPERARTLDFYRFYLFRLEQTALFVKAFTKDTPVEKVPTAPGNGNVGPEQMNHSCVWPPVMARHGLISACWSYDSPAAGKMHAETLRTAAEHGGSDVIVPPLYPEKHTPAQAVPMNAACISALNTRVNPWHFNGPLSAPNRTEWMKAVYYGARLAHATTGLTHTPPLTVWCPDSIGFSELVAFDHSEGENWKRLAQCLFDAGIDYGVTNTLAVPKDAVLLYACARPVLTAEEFARVRRFVEAGGTLVTAFPGVPELPDGTKIAGWDALPKERVHAVALSPAALKEKALALCKARNWETGVPAVKTYLYRQGAARVHLLNNTDFEAGVTVMLPAPMVDRFTGERLAAGTALSIRPGMHALLAEEQ